METKKHLCCTCSHNRNGNCSLGEALEDPAYVHKVWNDLVVRWGGTAPAIGCKGVSVPKMEILITKCPAYTGGHNCLDHFEDTGGGEFDGAHWFNRGVCTECGRKLTQVYRYQHTVDEEDKVVDK